MPHITEVRIRADGDGLHIEPYWSEVDRPYTGGWLFNDTPSNRRLADRLKAAILAGAFYGPAEIKTDRDGKTWACARGAGIGRTMNADLKRIGF